MCDSYLSFFFSLLLFSLSSEEDAAGNFSYSVLLLSRSSIIIFQSQSLFLIAQFAARLHIFVTSSPCTLPFHMAFRVTLFDEYIYKESLFSYSTFFLELHLFPSCLFWTISSQNLASFSRGHLHGCHSFLCFHVSFYHL